MTWKWADDSWLSKCSEYDKLTHAGMCAFFTCLASAILCRWFNGLGQALIGGTLVFIGGIILECWQVKHADGFSWRDVTANVAGILVASAAILEVGKWV